MVEYKIELDEVFGSLADATRRDILRRVAERELSVSEIATAYKRQMSLAAVSKHLRVLEKAHLIRKRRAGKERLVALSPTALSDASKYFDQYRQMWEERLDRLEAYLKDNK